jgi:YfiH family protein
MIVMTATILPEPAPAFHWTPVSWGLVLKCRPLDELADHFFTGRELRLRGDSPDAASDWNRVASEIGVAPANLWRMRQVHGCAIAAARSTLTLPPPEADGLLTADPEIALAVQVADCVPLLLADARTGAVAATHAGWLGAAANIAGATVRQLVERWRVNPGDLVAAIGPSIGPCCYQVGPEVKAAFLDQAGALDQRDQRDQRVQPDQIETWFQPDVPGKTPHASASVSVGATDRLKLDMWKVNRDQLVAAGLSPERIHVAGLCTASHVDHLYSYRVEGAATGRLLGVIRARGPAAR